MSAPAESPLSERSGLTAAVFTTLREDPAYLIPCPSCSFVGVDCFPATLRTPSIIARPIIGQYALAGCSGACSLCNEPLKGATPAEVATAWRDRVARFALTPDKHPLGRKTVNTLQRFHARGLLPSTFPMPAGL